MSTLYLVRLLPNTQLLMRWAGKHRLLRSGDAGYAWHAALKAALGDLAPKPFALVTRNRQTELLGYTQSDPRQWLSLAQDFDAVQAIGLDQGVQQREMPMDWQSSQTLSFEARVRPVARTRSGRSAIDERDVAMLARERDPNASIELAYRDWLQKELARGGAAQLLQMRLVSACSTRVLRKGAVQAEGGRSNTSINGPDVLLRGELRIEDGPAFSVLLARGLGRHRAFGFGCLLLAPAGVLR